MFGFRTILTNPNRSIPISISSHRSMCYGTYIFLCNLYTRSLLSISIIWHFIFLLKEVTFPELRNHSLITLSIEPFVSLQRVQCNSTERSSWYLKARAPRAELRWKSTTGASSERLQQEVLKRSSMKKLTQMCSSISVTCSFAEKT